MPIPLFPNKVANPFMQLDVHGGLFYYLPVPTPIPIPMEDVLHFGVGLLSMPVNGSLLGEDKSNLSKVLADGFAVVSRCHEPKHFIVPHINILPLPFSCFVGMFNLYMLPLVFASANKLEFAAGSVIAKDGPLAVSWYFGLSLSCCEPVSMPLGFPINWGSVLCGFTLGDFLAGVGCVLFDMAKSWAEGKLFDRIGTDIFKMCPNLFKGQTMAMMRAYYPRVKRFYWDNDAMKIAPTEQAFRKANFPALFGALYSRVVGGDLDADGVDALKEMVGPTGSVVVDFITGDLVTGYDDDSHEHGFAGQFGQWIDSQAEKLFSGSESVP